MVLAEPDVSAEERQRAEMVRDPGEGQRLAAAAAMASTKATWEALKRLGDNLDGQ